MKWKKVVIKVETSFVISVPADNTPEDTDFLFNDSCHCSSNEYRAIGQIVKDGLCVCLNSTFNYLRDATKEDVLETCVAPFHVDQIVYKGCKGAFSGYDLTFSKD